MKVYMPNMFKSLVWQHLCYNEKHAELRDISIHESIYHMRKKYMQSDRSMTNQ